MKTIHPAIAEHALSRVSELEAENEKLRGLLGEVRVLLANSSYKISGTAAFLHSIDAALSKQAEPSTLIAPFDLNEFARRAGQMMAKHDFHGFEPVALAIAEELLGAKAEPAPAQDERGDELEAIHQYAFEVGGTEGGRYMLEPEELDEVARRACEPFEDVLRSLACSLGAGGYNALTVDPAVFEQKIRWGIDQLTRPAQTEQQPVTGEQLAWWKEHLSVHLAILFRANGESMAEAERSAARVIRDAERIAPIAQTTQGDDQ
ncbi:hypothetical protein [Stutzerimonas nitrititolerans]|uniref:hypothetical protein n=1 Tax=Stutzerimonas nitrititolerans TaxID=2482751 RepID=UPI00289899AB|nr:hypothetical protein [Stutzerimonas nitrititolerans]